MSAAARMRGLLRTVSIMLRPGFFAAAVVLHDRLNRMQAAECGKAGIAQNAFDLAHPEAHGAINSLGHFLHDCIKQRVCGYDTCHEATQPFCMFCVGGATGRPGPSGGDGMYSWPSTARRRRSRVTRNAFAKSRRKK